MSFPMLKSAIKLLRSGVIIVDDYGLGVKFSGIGQVGFQIYSHILGQVRSEYSEPGILLISKTPFSSSQLCRWAFVTVVNFCSHFNRNIIYVGLANPASYFPLARQSHQYIYDVIPYELLLERRTLLYYAGILPLKIIGLFFSYANATVRLFILTRSRSTLYSSTQYTCVKIDRLIKPINPTKNLMFTHEIVVKDIASSLIANQSASSASPRIQGIISNCSLHKNSILIHSTGEPRKGFHELLPMICSLKHSLIVIYGKSWKGVGLKTIENLIKSSQVDVSNNIVIIDSASDVDVFALMCSFQIFVFPSRFEGYGLAPSIYSFLTKRKPYVAATRVNKEIMGDSAIIVDDWSELIPLLAKS